MPGFAEMNGVSVGPDGDADPSSQLFRCSFVGVETGPMISQVMICNCLQVCFSPQQVDPHLSIHLNYLKEGSSTPSLRSTSRRMLMPKLIPARRIYLWIKRSPPPPQIGVASVYEVLTRLFKFADFPLGVKRARMLVDSETQRRPSPLHTHTVKRPVQG